MTEDEKTAARGEIAELIQRYALASDFNDHDAYAALYTEDGVLELPGGVEIRGREALRTRPKPQDLQRRHYFMPPVLEFASGDLASGQGCCIVFTYDVAKQQADPARSVDYRTSFRRTPEGWRIARHSVRPSFGG